MQIRNSLISMTYNFYRSNIKLIWLLASILSNLVNDSLGTVVELGPYM